MMPAFFGRGTCIAGVAPEGAAQSSHQRGATPQGRSPGASASRRAGNLETWDPAARSRTPRFPGFQFLSFSPRRRPGGRDRAGAGGRAGRHACPPEWPRRTRAEGGHGLPRGPAPRVSSGAREVSSLDARAGARESPFGKAPSS